MIVKETLSPRRIVRYTARPMGWAAAWALAAPVAYEVTGSATLVLPFAPVGALGAALAIFIAFRNNASFARWNEARAAWQSILVASRALTRQVVASTRNAAAGGTVPEDEARALAREIALRQAAFARLVAGQVRAPVDWGAVAALVTADELAALRAAGNPASLALQAQAVRIKDGIRAGALGQFDPISMEPQLVALQQAQGVAERIATTPTPRQYAYFTRRFVLLFAALAPFGLLSVVPDAIWWAAPLALALSGVFIIMEVTGTANDEPFAGAVTDVPIATIAAQVERDVREQLGDAELPTVPVAVDGYLW